MIEFFSRWWSEAPWTLVATAVGASALGFAVTKHFWLDPSALRHRTARSEVFPLILQDISHVLEGLPFWNTSYKLAYKDLLASGKMELVPRRLKQRIEKAYGVLAEFGELKVRGQAAFEAAARELVSSLRTEQDDRISESKRQTGPPPTMGSPVYDLRWLVRGYPISAIPDEREYLLLDGSTSKWFGRVTCSDLARAGLTESDIALRLTNALRSEPWFDRLATIENEVKQEFLTVRQAVQKQLSRV